MTVIKSYSEIRFLRDEALNNLGLHFEFEPIDSFWLLNRKTQIWRVRISMILDIHVQQKH